MKMIKMKGGQIAEVVGEKIIVQRDGDRFIVLGDGLIDRTGERSNSYGIDGARGNTVNLIDLTDIEIHDRLT